MLKKVIEVKLIIFMNLKRFISLKRPQKAMHEFCLILLSILFPLTFFHTGSMNAPRRSWRAFAEHDEAKHKFQATVMTST